MKFFAKILTQFLARHNPLSTMAKPAFIQNTSMPVNNTQTVSNAIRMLLIPSLTASVAAGTAAAVSCAHPVAASPSPAMANKIAVRFLFVTFMVDLSSCFRLVKRKHWM